MNSNIIIDRLDIRFKGIPPKLAHSSIEGLDKELLEELTRQINPKEKTTIKINKIDSSIIKTQDTNSSELRKMIVKNIGNTINMKIGVGAK